MLYKIKKKVKLNLITAAQYIQVEPEPGLTFLKVFHTAATIFDLQLTYRPNPYL